MLDERFTSRSEAETVELAKKFAPLLKNGDVVCLYGDLGTGKTAFCRALIQTLTQSSTDVPSPTFTLVQTYDHEPPLWHFDLYRLEDPEEVYEIGWEEALSNGIALVEWPERIVNLLPARRHEVHIQSINENVREFMFTSTGLKNV